MTERLNYFKTAPQAMETLFNQEAYFNEAFKDKKILWELVKLRVSQINQCAFCIDMHSKATLELGETKERIFGLNAWRDMPLYSEAELSALHWAELQISNKPITDGNYQQTLAVLGGKLLVDLTIAINAINSWNKIVKAFKPAVGSFSVN